MIGKNNIKFKAFSLIELLVVITIIGILLSLIIPTITNFQRRAKETYCRNNLKQLHSAFMAYTIDNDGSLPAAKSSEYQVQPPWPNAGMWELGSKGWVDWYGWAEHGGNNPQPGKNYFWGELAYSNIMSGSLIQYVGSNHLEIFSCPFFNDETYFGSTAPDGSPLIFDKPKLGFPTNMIYRTYFMNANCQGKIGNMEASRVLLLGEMNIDKQTSGVTIAEITCMDPSDGASEEAWDGALEGTNTASGYPKESVGIIHGSGDDRYSYGIFADGHVEKLRPDQTTNACSGNW